MRTTFRWDKDMECLIEVGSNSNFFEDKPQTAFVVRDDVGFGVNGLRHMPTGKMLDSKSAFRRADKSVGRECVGNEQNFARKPDAPERGHYEREAKRAGEMLTSNHNGMRDRVNRLNQITQYNRQNQR